MTEDLKNKVYWIDCGASGGVRTPEVYGALRAAVFGFEDDARSAAADLTEDDERGLEFSVSSGPMPDWARVSVVEVIIDSDGVEHPQEWQGEHVPDLDDLCRQVVDAVEAGDYHTTAEEGIHEVEARIEMRDYVDELLAEQTFTAVFES